jgi:hypothetical protein
MKTKLLFLLLITITAFTSIGAQNSPLVLSVKWKRDAFAHKVELYNTANDLLLTLCDDTQCYQTTQSGSTNKYSVKYDLGCVPNGSNYYVKIYDIANDGWNNGRVKVKVNGAVVVDDRGTGANTSGQTIYFNVSGGDSTCNNAPDFDGDGIADNLDFDDDGDGIADSAENMGEDRFECTLPSLDFKNGAYDVVASLGASAGTVGSVYRFGNSIAGYDVLMEITELDNTTIANIDDDTIGIAEYLQTTLTFSGTGTPGATFKFTIVHQGTIIPSTEIFRVNGITWDCDGTTTLLESVVYHNPAAYGIENPSDLTVTDLGSNNIEITSDDVTVNGFSTLPWLRAYYQYIGNSFTMRMQAFKTTTSSSTRQFMMSFTQCDFLDFSSNNLTIITGQDFDGDGLYNHLEIDSDNDGIPDNVEAQSTLGYQEPSGIISSNGIDLVYGNGLDVVDTDGDKTPDFLDLDSDNDGATDINENGMASLIPLFLDNDNDGLDDIFEGVSLVDYDVNDEINNPSYSILPDNDGDLFSGGDLDYRDYYDVNPAESATIDFDGVDDYLSSGSLLDFSNSDFTMSSWVKLDSNNGNFAIMGRLATDQIRTAASTGISLEAQAGSTSSPSKLYFLVYNNNNLRIIKTINRVLPKNKWVHVTATYDGSNVLMYINGELVSTNDSELARTDMPDLTGIDFTIGGIYNELLSGTRNHFDGAIDEVRVFNAALTEDQVQRMVYQEIEENSGNVHGSVIAKDVVDISIEIAIPWANLKGYYPMTNIVTNKTLDFSLNNNHAVLHNISTIQPQTAPMPYETVLDGGTWTKETTWLHGDVWDITDVNNNKDWSIVHIKNNISTTNSHKNIGLIVDNNKTLTVNGENYIDTSWYLELDGVIDLKGDSQLIQGEKSDLVTGANGRIKRRQEGTGNVFRYNHWSSPVGATSVSLLSDNNTALNNNNNKPYSLDMLKDGNGDAIQFTNSHNEIGKVSKTWLYTFKNGVTYYDWNHLTIDEPVGPGLGYSQKGTGLGTTQQYIFEGKPNNGTILIDAVDTGGEGSVSGVSGTSTMLGNPYASALDARQFIDDNTNADPTAGKIDGTLMLWEHWGGDSHVRYFYEGGYAYINRLTTVRAVQYPYSTDMSTMPGGTKRPSFYIAPGQGFFVEVINAGDIEFNNGQRAFIKESDASPENPGAGSVFFKNSPPETSGQDDEYQLLRLELSMSDTSSRTMVLGFHDTFTDNGRENGFDGGFVTTPLVNDLGSLLNGDQYVIQALAPITTDKVVDLTFTATGTETYTIKSIEIAHIDENQELYLRDNLLDVYHNLRDEEGYSFTSEAGTFNDRFDVVFKANETLSTEDFNSVDNTTIFYSSNQQALFVKGLKDSVKQLTLYNTLGQNIFQKQNLSTQQMSSGIAISNLSTGMYIVSIKTENNQTLDKKIIIE